MRILGIESSCDDSSIAMLDMRNGRVHRVEQLVASQDVHAKYGGVVPEVAAREHSATLPPLLDALAARLGAKDGRRLGAMIDAVAVTGGPGLATSLRVGLDTARGLALEWGRPLYTMNHIEGHICSNWLPVDGKARLSARSRPFPALVLVVSGGHTELLLMRGHGKYRLLGSTRDDAAGEAFDKTAKLMGLGYPGGPAISKLAAHGDPAAFDFPRPMIASSHLDMSFSGLKTSVRYFLREHEKQLGDPLFTADVAASVQRAIVDVLVAKTVRAAKRTKARTVLLAGGVAANGLLRDSLRETLAARVPAVSFVEPPLRYCTDNAAMVAMAAYFRTRRSKKGDDPRKVDARPDWELGRV